MASPEQMEVVYEVIRWLEIKSKFEYPEETRLKDIIFHLMADADHSALLARLLDGKEPLPKPAPLHFSYPWYSLIDNGYGDAYEVWEPLKKYPDNEFYKEHYQDVLVVDQSSWKIVERISDNHYVIEFNDYKFTIRPFPEEREKPYPGANWLLEKLENDSEDKQ